MTIKKTVALLLAVMLLAASTAFAASTSGTSKGGTMGKCTCGGQLTLNNGSTRDSAMAKTTSNAKGKLSVLAKIYWSNGEKTVDRSNSNTSKDSTISPVTVYADNIYAIKALSTHAYTSPEYGTWYGTVNDKF